MAAAVLTAAYVAASLSSIAPRVAWDGAYVRRQGTYAFLSYVACFLVVSFVLRTHGQVRRFVRAMLLTSVFPVAYAICQRAGFDVAVWNNPTPWRVTSTAGNPIFLGGYLDARDHDRANSHVPLEHVGAKPPSTLERSPQHIGAKPPRARWSEAPESTLD